MAQNSICISAEVEMDDIPQEQKEQMLSKLQWTRI